MRAMRQAGDVVMMLMGSLFLSVIFVHVYERGWQTIKTFLRVLQA
jgi:hypothetical protein